MQAYSFKYSPRPGTPAAGIDSQVDEAVKSERLARLQELLNRQQLAFNQASVGQQVPILMERNGRHSGQRVGRSPRMQSVHVEAPNSVNGQIVQVDILSAGPKSLRGRLAKLEPALRKEPEAAE